ncbi:MAG: zinc ABC transporter substrate-binding protein, partial [Sulfuricurvum sp.]|uniref:metal ABC transporter substrate-binding protein n=1 Tax=Sulfuricurvum sp. TaxID=2025608 RepID=UPI0025D502D8
MRMETKRLIIFGVILVASVVGMSFFAPSNPTKTIRKPSVSVSTFTLYEAVHAVAGESLDVRPIIPPGSDAHMFSPTPKQVADIGQSSLFIYNGAGFEMWGESLKNTLPATTEVLDMSAHVRLIKSEGGDGMDAEDHHGG